VLNRPETELPWLPWSLTHCAEVVLLYKNKVHDLPE
jgi:hypothetical protein